jgi:hypothetical protein
MGHLSELAEGMMRRLDEMLRAYEQRVLARRRSNVAADLLSRSRQCRPCLICAPRMQTALAVPGRRAHAEAGGVVFGDYIT